MKDYKEMAEDVLRRRDIYMHEKKRRTIRTASVLACFCVVVVLGAGGWYGRIPSDDAPGQDADAQPGDIINSPDVTDNLKDEHLLKKEMETAQSPITDAIVSMGEAKDKDTEEPTDAKKPMAPRADNDGMSENIGNGTDIDLPVTDIPGDTGELTPYDEVWGGCYMDQDGCWVVWLTEDTPENRQMVFTLNPTLNENNTTFKTADYSKAYLTYLMAEISKAMGDGSLPLVTSAALREERNRVEVTMTGEDPYSEERILSFDTVGGAIDIIYSDGHVILNLIKSREP